jgi:hypothetical protein
MSLQKIKSNELFINQVEFNPKVSFFIYNGKSYYNKQTEISGAFTSNIGNVPVGNISLYELNVDRNQSSTGLIYPFITKNGSLTSFKTISTTSFNSDFSYGDIITGSYPLSASITRDYYQSGESRSRADALRNTINYYNGMSKYYQYSASFGNKATMPLNLISIPSIFYGNNIEKGTIKLDFYISGTLIGTLEDKNKNGELIQTAPSGSNGSGSVAGIALYTEGFLVLTGSWGLENGIARNYLNDISNQVTSSWLYFATGLGGNEVFTDGMIPSSSFDLAFNGTNKVPIMTMLLHSKRGELNNSSNPTFIKYNSLVEPITGSNLYVENKEIQPANVVSSSYVDPEPYLEKTTFISSIKLYDENKNVIGIAKIAKPVRKTQERDLTFKLKLDL